jgi:hypothetical protein
LNATTPLCAEPFNFPDSTLTRVLSEAAQTGIDIKRAPENKNANLRTSLRTVIGLKSKLIPWESVLAPAASFRREMQRELFLRQNGRSSIPEDLPFWCQLQNLNLQVDQRIAQAFCMSVQSLSC